MPTIIVSGSSKIQILIEPVMEEKPNIHWDDIAGLTVAKESLKEAMIFPVSSLTSSLVSVGERKVLEIFVGGGVWTRRVWQGNEGGWQITIYV